MWISFLSTVQAHLIWIWRVGFDFVGIRRGWFDFIWIGGGLSWWSHSSTFLWSRLFHSDVVRHPAKNPGFPRKWKMLKKVKTLSTSQKLKASISSCHLSSVSSPVSWSMIRTQSLAGAGSVFPWNNYDDGVITGASKGMWWWERPGQVMQNSPCKWFDQLHHCEAGWPQHFSHLSPEEQQCHNQR